MSVNSDSVSTLSSSATKVFTDKVTHTWTIENFKFHEAKKADLESSSFAGATNDGYKWRLFVKFTVDDYVYLGLTLDFDDSTVSDEVMAECFFHFLDDKQKIVWSRNYSAIGICKFIRNGTHLLNSELIYCNNLRKNYLFHDKLIIRCDITFSDMKIFTTPDHHVFKIPKCSLSEDMSSLLENHHHSDVVLSANGKDYPVHKNILAARSTVFAAMFKHDTKENKENRVEINDMNEEVLGEMLSYIYTGKCENLNNLAEDLIAAADKYALDRLKMMCAEMLFQNLSIENVSQSLELAETHGVKELKNEAIQFIVAKPLEVFCTAGAKSLLSNSKLMDEVFQKK